MKLKNAADIKWYLNLSKAKLEMLFSQIGRAEKVKSSIEWKMSVGAAALTRRSESEEVPDQDDMLKAVIGELEAAGQVGTIYEPNVYIKGIMPMRWGMYDDDGMHDPAEGPMVYFGGLDAERRVLLGLGGSSKHVQGCEGATSTHSRSITQVLVETLLRGIEHGVTDLTDDEHDRDVKDDLFRAIAIAQHYLRPPTQQLEFFARTLLHGKTHRAEMYIGVPDVRVILGTPLFVALAHPYPQDTHVGIIPD
jgi:hypothetical protein